MTTVALLGTGIMGSAMARSMLRAGLTVRVWNRTPDSTRPLVEAGARAAGDPAGAVRDADVVLTMLTDARAVLDVMDAAAPGLSAGQIWAQVSTVGVRGQDRLAGWAREHDLVFVDAPVQGTRQPAEAGQLMVLASGPDEAREPLRPVFEAIGGDVRWVGPAGAGSRLKMATNSYLLTLTNGAAEALALTEGLGLDPRLLLDTLRSGPLDSPYLQMKGSAMVDRAFSPASFAAGNAAKDAGLVLEAADEAGLRLDVARAGAERYRRAVDLGHGEEDLAATYLASLPDGKPPRAPVTPTGG
jgi:3-hydroxyisobutyrate dehydrogenase